MTGFLDWPRALACSQWAVSRPEQAARIVAAAVAEAPCFRNREFPLSPVPLLVRQAAAERVKAELENYVRLLGAIVARYREDPEIRRWYGLDAAAERLIAADTRLGDTPWVCRLDGYLEQPTERLLILENNADAPAGTLFTARINALLAGIVAAAGIRSWEPAPLTYQGRDRFLGALLQAAEMAGAPAPDHVAVLQPRGAANRESTEMVAEFRAAGLDAYLADPRELRVTGGRARFGDRPVDLCWNKVNTVGWQAMAADGELAAVWERALGQTDLVQVNSFGARYVAENKLTLALPQEPAFAARFTESERALAAALLPWSRKVTRETPAPCGERSLVADLLDAPADYVLKEPYDIRGDGVTIGHDTPPARWRSAVSRALDAGHLAQRRVRPVHYPVVHAGSTRVEFMPVSLDSFLLGGRFAGFGSKASRHAKINIFQGGQKLGVHVVTKAE